MKLIEDYNPGEYLLFIATGDGRTELHIIRALSKIYDGSKIIYFPQHSHSYKRKTGLSILDILQYSTISADRYLFILDKEHVKKDCKEEIKEKLEKINLKEIKIKLLINEENAKLYMIECKRGSKSIIAYIAISGKEEMIEENVSYLIYLEYGYSINIFRIRETLKKKGVKTTNLHTETKKHIKNKIKNFLRDKRFKGRGLEKIESFIKSSYKNSGKKNIEKAFPHLTEIFKELEK